MANQNVLDLRDVAAKSRELEGQVVTVEGWVRNRRDGTVEALVGGEEAAVQALLSACRRGPPLAAVHDITEEFADPPEEPGFRRLPNG